MKVVTCEEVLNVGAGVVVLILLSPFLLVAAAVFVLLFVLGSVAILILAVADRVTRRPRA